MSTAATNEPARLLLIDGHSMAFRAFYGLPPENFTTSTGQYTNAVYGFTSMLINLLRDEQPTHIGVAFDVSRHTFRTDEYADYKGTRSATPEPFKGQIDLIKQVLDALSIVHAELDDYEGDDILATWSKQGDDNGWENLIVSGDRDSFQLVDGNTTVLYPKRGVSELARMTPAAVEEKYGVLPERYPEVAALVGETSDNLPGVPGVGNKTAAKWLNQYDGLQNLLAHADEIKGKAGESLREHIDDVKRNRRLNRLVRDLPLPVGVDGLERKEINSEAVDELFGALEFRMLRDRLSAVFFNVTEEVTPEQSFDLAIDQVADGRLGDWLKRHSGKQAVGINIVGTWGSGAGDIDSVAFATIDDEAISVDPATLRADDAEELANWLADSDVPKVMHDAKGPLLALWSRGLDLQGLNSDTQLAAYLLRPDQRGYNLDDLALRHLGRELVLPGACDDPQAPLDFDEGKDNTLQSILRARAAAELADVLAAELDETGQLGLLHDVELPLQRVLAKMEQRGIAADVNVLESQRSEFDGRVVSAEKAAFDAIGKKINLASPMQLQTVLFEDLGMPKTKRTKRGYTTDAAALESLYAKTSHPFLEHLLEHRDAIKMRQIIDGLIKSISDDGRVHTTYVQTAAGTGRLSSTEPNLQNIPIRTLAGRQIRDAFVFGEDFEGLMSADYSQIEMRVMADASDDEALIEAFTSGVDFHTVTASHVFSIPVDEVTGDQRSSVKQMNYGLAYGLSSYGLASRLNIEVGAAQALMDDYFKTFGGVHDYLAGVVEEARKQGYTATLLGRRRYLPDLNSSNRQRRQMAERMALNAPIQGTAADIIKVAMLQVEHDLAAGGFKSRMLLQIHDELVLEIAPGEKERVQELVADRMAHAVQLKVPLEVSFGFGKSWNAAAH